MRISTIDALKSRFELDDLCCTKSMYMSLRPFETFRFCLPRVGFPSGIIIESSVFYDKLQLEFFRIFPFFQNLPSLNEHICGKCRNRNQVLCKVSILRMDQNEWVEARFLLRSSGRHNPRSGQGRWISQRRLATMKACLLLAFLPLSRLCDSKLMQGLLVICADGVSIHSKWQGH